MFAMTGIFCSNKSTEIKFLSARLKMFRPRFPIGVATIFINVQLVRIFPRHVSWNEILILVVIYREQGKMMPFSDLNLMLALWQRFSALLILLALLTLSACQADIDGIQNPLVPIWQPWNLSQTTRQLCGARKDNLAKAAEVRRLLSNRHFISVPPWCTIIGGEICRKQKIACSPRPILAGQLTSREQTHSFILLRADYCTIKNLDGQKGALLHLDFQTDFGLFRPIQPQAKKRILLLLELRITLYWSDWKKLVGKKALATINTWCGFLPENDSGKQSFYRCGKGTLMKNGDPRGPRAYLGDLYQSSGSEPPQRRIGGAGLFAFLKKGGLYFWPLWGREGLKWGLELLLWFTSPQRQNGEVDCVIYIEEGHRGNSIA